jgi:hypothetical protein
MLHEYGYVRQGEGFIYFIFIMSVREPGWRDLRNGTGIPIRGARRQDLGSPFQLLHSQAVSLDSKATGKSLKTRARSNVV